MFYIIINYIIFQLLINKINVVNAIMIEHF